MGFSALQGKGVHEALLARQDSEIRLIETMRRCLSQKAKCDRDYATAMVNVAQTGLKIDRGDDLTGKLFQWLKLSRDQRCRHRWRRSTWPISSLCRLFVKKSRIIDRDFPQFWKRVRMFHKFVVGSQPVSFCFSFPASYSIQTLHDFYMKIIGMRPIKMT